MTLLILDIRVPQPAPQPSEASLVEELAGLVPKILGYGSGFVILGTLWVGHHYQFRYIRRSDRALLWVNLVFLLAIAFLPFVVALIGAWGPMRTTCLLYGSTLLLAGTCLLTQWHYAASGRRRLVPRDLSDGVFRAIRNRVMFGMGGYGAGLVLAFFAPRASLICYAILPLFYLLPSRIDVHVKGTCGSSSS